MGLKPPHRGASGDKAEFARRFIRNRIGGFQKDMEICLKDTPNRSGKGMTHAYFPALGTCCAFLEYMTGLHRGNLKGIGSQQIKGWSRAYLPQPDYDDDTAYLLFEAFRHSVAHRGIATGVYVEGNGTKANGRRVTWRLSETSERPSCRLIRENGVLKQDPPWECAYTHRMHISLAALGNDLAEGAKKFASEVFATPVLQENFRRVMQGLYPK